MWRLADSCMQRASRKWRDASTQGCVRLIHLYHSHLPLITQSSGQLGSTTYGQNGLINRYSAYHTACHTSKERPTDTFTLRKPSSWAVLLVSPSAFNLLSSQSPLGALNTPGFSDTVPLESHKYVAVKKTEGQGRQHTWSFKMHNSR